MDKLLERHVISSQCCADSRLHSLATPLPYYTIIRGPSDKRSLTRRYRRYPCDNPISLPGSHILAGNGALDLRMRVRSLGFWNRREIDTSLHRRAVRLTGLLNKSSIKLGWLLRNFINT